MVYIGIDPGTHTGVAVWEEGEFTQLSTLPIHRAMEVVLSYRDRGEVMVIFEDARQSNYHGRDMHNRARLQGAGSVKRDCNIWEEFCTEKGIKFHAFPPNPRITKMDAKEFQTQTGWKGRTSNHARDAAMLVFQNRHVLYLL